MTMQEITTGLKETTAAAIKAEIKATLQQAKLLAAALAAKGTEDAEELYDSIRELLNGME